MNDHLHFKDKVVARLRKSKAEFEEHEKADGREAGRKWACETAEYGDLLRVAVALARVVCGDNIDAAVTEAILGHSFSQWEFHELWSKTGNETPSQTYIHAFANGALELWREVVAEVEPSPEAPAGDETPGDNPKDEDRWQAIADSAYAIDNEPTAEPWALAAALERFQGCMSEDDWPGVAVRRLLENLIRNRVPEHPAVQPPALFS